MMKPYLLENAHLKSIAAGAYSVAILPWGATEAHNYHLPYGTDTFQVRAIAEEAARKAWNGGARCLVLPALPFGVNTGQMKIPGTINLYPSTQAVIINDILESLHGAGIMKFILLNGHGGNDFRQILREAGSTFPDMILITANWYQSIDRSAFFTVAGDHADEMETSLMMYLHSELVLPLSEAGKGQARSFRISELNESWAWSERKWERVTEDTGIGDPSDANSEKGKKAFDAICEKVSGLISAVASTDEADLYT